MSSPYREPAPFDGDHPAPRLHPLSVEMTLFLLSLLYLFVASF